MLVNGLIGDVVRRDRVRIFGKGGFAVASAVEQQVAVTHAGLELPVRISAAGPLEGFDQFACDVAGDLAGGEALHPAVFDGDQIAANRPILGREFDPLRSGLQRRPAGVVDQRVVAEEAHRADVASGGHRFRHVIGQSTLAPSGDFVHVGQMGGLERSASAEFGLRLIGASIGNDEHVLHVTSQDPSCCTGMPCDASFDCSLRGRAM